jgi:hypothetical protein
MIRMILGAALSAVAMFVIGFIFFGPTGLSNVAIKSVDDVPAAAISSVLSANLPATGTYMIPNDQNSPAQTAMYGNGPVATVHYNTAGFVAGGDPTTLGTGFVFNFIIALLIGLAMVGIDGRVSDFGSRARVAVLIALAGVGFAHLSEPIYYHHDWPYFIYVFVADGLMLTAVGLIFAWILPRPAASAAAPEDAPAEV